MKTFWYRCLIILLVLSSYQAQASNGMEEYFYSSGKIKVVVAVAAVVMIGLLLAVLRIDRKVSRLEKKLDRNK